MVLEKKNITLNHIRSSNAFALLTRFILFGNMSSPNLFPSNDSVIPSIFREIRSDSLSPVSSANDSHAPFLLTSGFSPQGLILRSSSLGNDDKARPSSRAVNAQSGDDVNDDDFAHPTNNRDRSRRHSKWSPTPSTKRGKAEKLLKEHGSPPGIRVTAGGRIVPEGLLPFGALHTGQYPPNKLRPAFDRFSRLGGPSLIKASHGDIFWLDGVLHQVVHDRIRAVKVVDGYAQYYLPPSNYSDNGFIPHGQLDMQTNHPFFASAGEYGQYNLGPSADHISDHRQFRIREEQHNRLEQELKDLDRHSVLYRDSLSPSIKADLVRMRIELINKIDLSRRSLVEMKKLHIERGQNMPTHGYHPNRRSASMVEYVSERDAEHVDFPIFPPEAYYTGSQSQYGYDTGNFMEFESSEFEPTAISVANRQNAATALNENSAELFGGTSLPRHERAGLGEPLQDRAGNIVSTTLQTQWGTDGSVNSKMNSARPTVTANTDNVALFKTQPRRSHAVEIKAPADFGTHKSSLNPASPAYEPNRASRSDNAQQPTGPEQETPDSPDLVRWAHRLVASPTPPKQLLPDSSTEHYGSASSATTGDFFPTNTEHYSGQRHVSVATESPNQCESVPPSLASPHHDSRSIEEMGYPWDDSPRNKINVKLPAAYAHTSQGKPQNIWHPAGSPPDPNGPGARDLSLQKMLSLYSDPAPGLFGAGNPSAFDNRNPTSHEEKESLPKDTRHHVKDQPEEYGFQLGLQAELEQKFAEAHLETSQTPDYIEGFTTGLQQLVMAADMSETYRIGYRDGLIAAARRSKSGDLTVPSMDIHPSERSDSRDTSEHSISVLGTQSGGRSLMTTAGSVTISTLPASNTDSNPTFARPPTPMTCVGPGWKVARLPPFHGSTFITYYGGKPGLVPSAPPSPLTERHVMDGGKQGGQGMSFAERASAQSSTSMEEQRFVPGRSSTATNNAAVHAMVFLPQFNGSGEDGASADGPEAPGTPRSPTGKGRGTSRSPVKAKASAAMAKIEQFTGLNKRERSSMDEANETARAGSPEKEKWHSKWRKRFENVKDQEQKEDE